MESLNIKDHMDILVSVIITTYRRNHLLGRAVTSVLHQSHTKLEIIIVDDNADQLLGEEIENLIADFEDARIKLIHNSKNLGGALSRNEGIKYSAGEFIAFLDDDDVYSEEKIEKQLQKFYSSDQKNLALVYTWNRNLNRNGDVIYEQKNSFCGNCVYECMLDCLASTSLWLCRKEALKSVGMFTDTPCKQDSFLIAKLMFSGYSVDYVPEFLLEYNEGEADRISTAGHEKRIRGEEKLLNFYRDHYYMITKEQSKEVEYCAATRLIVHYIGAKQFSNALHSLRLILFRHPLKRNSLRCYKRILQNLFGSNS